MKKNRRIQLALYSLIILVSWMIVGLGRASREELPCLTVQTIIRNTEQNHFLNDEIVREIIQEVQGRPAEACRMGELDIAAIERHLEGNPYVRSAEAWRKPNGTLAIELELRNPIARVMPPNGPGFYFDPEFNKIALSDQYSANTVLVRGYVTEPLEPAGEIVNPYLQALKPLMDHLQQDEFLSSQISEIVVGPDGQLTLYPEVGDMRVIFGTAEGFEEKFKKLKIFYEEVLNVVGWDRYQQLDLRFKDQFVAS